MQPRRSRGGDHGTFAQCTVTTNGLQCSRGDLAAVTVTYISDQMYNLAASMQPRRSRRGDDERCGHKQYADPASMQPRRSRRGDSYQDNLSEPNRTASMQPRRSRRGDTISKGKPSCCAPCFNAAAAISPR